MNDGLKKANLPQTVSVSWAQPTDDGKARYVVNFGSNLEPAHLEALNRLLGQSEAFLGAEAGPASNQATVFVSNSDADHVRLDWLKLDLQPHMIGTVIAELYPEVRPAIARLVALGDVQFDNDDLPLIGSLPGVDHVVLADGVVRVVFQEDAIGQTLTTSFLHQEVFAVTMVTKPGEPPAA